MRSQDLNVVIGNLRHSLSLFKCAAMSLEALRSYRLVEAKICGSGDDMEKAFQKSGVPTVILKAYMQLVSGL